MNTSYISSSDKHSFHRCAVALGLFFTLCLSCEKSTSDDPVNPNNNTPNTSFGAAYEINDGQAIEAQVSGSDNKFYRIQFSTHCLARIQVGNAPSRFRLFVYESDAATSDVLRTDWIDIGEDASFVAGPMGAGTHYIVVDPYANDGGNFRFTVNYDCLDTSEPNNTFGNATLLTVGEPTTGKILAVNDANDYEDLDIFKFNIPDTHAVAHITFTAPGDIAPNGDFFRCGVYNAANYDTHLEYKDAKAGEVKELWVGPLSPGDHFIGLNLNNGKGLCHCQADNPYTLKVELDYRDANEPNDIATENASPMNLDQIYQGTILYPNGLKAVDVDWFTFTPLQSGTYRFELKSLPTVDNTRAYIFDSPGAAHLAYFYKNNGLDVFKDLALNAGQTYWIKVDLADADDESTGTYNIRVVKL